MLNDCVLACIIINSEGVNSTFYNTDCGFCRTNLTTLPRYMLEADTELTPGIQTSALQSLVRTLYVSREPLEVVVRRATVRKDLCTREGLQVTLLKVMFCSFLTFL